MKFEKGFFSFLGNQLTFSGFSKYLFFSIFLLALLVFVGIWLFRYEIRKRYEKLEQSPLFFKKEALIFRIIGILILTLGIFRIILLVSQNFVNTWEMIPLHLCRLNFFLIGLIMISGRLEYIKYITFTSVVGALIGLSIPGLGYRIPIADGGNINNWEFIADWNKPGSEWTLFTLGMDTYIYWEFLFTHILVFLTPYIIIIIKSFKFTLKNFIQSWILLVSLIVITFLINSITGTYVKNPRWKTNYFFNGMPPINEFNYALPPITSWPFSVVSEIIVGSAFVFIVFLVYCVQDKFYLYIDENKKIKFIKQKSNNWENIKEQKIKKLFF